MQNSAGDRDTMPMASLSAKPMVKVLNASSLTLEEACDRLQLRFQFEEDLRAFLDLQPLTPQESERAAEIRQAWERYYIKGKICEGQVNLMALSPLLWASGYTLDPAIRISMEENIEEIAIDDGETVIRGRMDVIITRAWESKRVPLCILIIETKNSAASAAVGLPQLLTYAGAFLEQQELVWGLATNGTDYQFVRVERGLYRQFRSLSLLSPEDTARILEVVISLRKGDAIAPRTTL